MSSPSLCLFDLSGNLLRPRSTPPDNRPESPARFIWWQRCSLPFCGGGAQGVPRLQGTPPLYQLLPQKTSITNRKLLTDNTSDLYGLTRPKRKQRNDHVVISGMSNKARLGSKTITIILIIIIAASANLFRRSKTIIITTRARNPVKLDENVLKK